MKTERARLCESCDKHRATYIRTGWGDVHCQKCVETKLSGSFEPLEKPMKTRIKILVSSGKRAERKGDFCFVPEGEIVKFGFACDNACTCGCGRSLVGAQTHASTTVFRVERREMTMALLAEILEKSWNEEGWGKPISGLQFVQAAHELLQIASRFKEGTELQIKNGKIKKRAAK